MRQQFSNTAGGLSGQACEDILQIGIRIMPIELGGLNQRHDDCGPLARSQRACKQPVRAANGHRPDLLFDMIVIHWQLPIIQIARQCHPAFQAVVQCFGSA